MLTNKYWYKGVDLESDKHQKEESRADSQNDYRDEYVRMNSYDYIIISLLLETQKMCQLTLPATPGGRYCFECKGNTKLNNSLFVQEYKGKWFLYSVKPIYMYIEEGQYCTYLELRDQQLINVKNGDDQCKIFVEYLCKENFSYHNYRIADKRITVGRGEVCDIVYRSEFVLDKEVEFLFENGQWEITRFNKQGIVFVNGKRIIESKLEVGDIVYIMGLTIIIGIGFFSINDCNKRIFIKPNRLMKINNVEEASYFVVDNHQYSDLELFNRRPRRRLSLNEREIQIDAPPMALNGDRIPLMLRMGGSMFHGATSMLSGNPTMMISSVLFPILNSKYTEKQKKEYEERRVKKYTEYLENKKKEIEEERKEEERILNYNYPELQCVLTFAEDGMRLWERRKTDDDFLNIRLGNGNVPLIAQYRCAKERFSLEDDILEDKMYELVNTKVECQHAPIMNSFRDNHVCGILGTKILKMSLIKRLIMQIALTHSYDEVKMIFLIDEESLEEIDFVKYLSHVWDEEKYFRFIATNTSEAYQIGKYLKEKLEAELDDRNLRAAKLEECLRQRPYYLIFAFEKKLFDNVGVLKDILQSDNNIGISIVTAFDDLPKECSKIFQLQSNGKHVVTHLEELDKEDVYFQLDAYDYDLAKKSMGIVSNTNLKVENESASLPKMITFLEMFGAGKIEHLNSAVRWRESNPARTLTTPVGVGNDGTLFMLDLHQKYHGPHGLIAGMTGSGKSEFIITYILSLAVNYRPDEVAFLLIDYKGGGLTSAFEDPVRNIYLPHLVGTITNLDGAAINRSIISIESEITRRQKLFREAKSIVDESTIDIYSYQKLYREGYVKEALPHLFIIADEFAEMKQQEPEFMDSLISIARIGRSLGVHLILATQKPSGVVNDQIRSNTKFRICLKVQDKSDSMDMLKRPEGAEIKETGRFYLQVGYNELFAIGQSAWTGADYQPQEEMSVKRDDSVVFLDTLGQSLHEEKPAVKKESTGKSELSEIVKYLSNLAETEGIPRKQLWKEPLPRIIDSQSVIPEIGENEFNVYLGEIDDPAHQKQYPYVYNFMECKNILIVGASKSGKTSMVQNILFQFTTQYAAEDINYYILDYSSHLLKVFQKVPHCGAVLSEDDISSVKKLFDLIDGLAEERRRVFKELEVDNIKDARIKQRMPLVFIVIDNLAVLRDTKEIESFYYNLNSIMKNVSNYGIHFIITCTHLNEATARIRQEIGKCFSFGMKDKYEYQEALGCKVNYTPPAFPGRGLINFHNEPLEFHAAIFGAQYDQKQKIDRIKEILSKVNESNIKAKKLASFTPDEMYKDFSALFEKGRIPLGYSLLDSKPIALPLKQLRTLAVYMGNPNGRIPIFENLLTRAQFEQMDVTIISRQKESVFKRESDKTVGCEYLQNVHVVECEQETIYETNKNILLELMEKKKYLKDYCIEHNIDMKEVDVLSKDFQKQSFSYISKRVKPRLIILESVKDICEIANDEVSAAINGLCLMAPLYNTYIIHCYEPGDGEKVKEHAIRKVLVGEEMVLMFGGCYDKQGLINLEYGYSSIQKPINYNQVLMKYRGNIHELIMPCGPMKEEVMEKDDESIF